MSNPTEISSSPRSSRGSLIPFHNLVERVKTFLSYIFFDRPKLLLFFPLMLIVFSSSVLVYNKIHIGEFVEKDYTLKGGIKITILYPGEIDKQKVSRVIKDIFGVKPARIEDIYDYSEGRRVGWDIIVDVTTKEIESTESIVKEKLSEALGVDKNKITVDINAPIEKIGLGIVGALLLSILLMGIPVYICFRNIGSVAGIILSTILDVIDVLAFCSIIGIKLSLATLGALLVIIGYSTDSDALLSNAFLRGREEGNIRERVKTALRTELTMDVAAITIYIIMFTLSNNPVIKTIGVVSMLGVIFDFINTWCLSSYILRRIFLGDER